MRFFGISGYLAALATVLSIFEQCTEAKPGFLRPETQPREVVAGLTKAQRFERGLPPKMPRRRVGMKSTQR